MAADSVANLLLRITGNADDGEDTLGKMATELSAFDKIDAEAEATVDTDRKDLDRLQRDLTDFGRQTATAEGDVDIRQARAHVGEMQAILKRLDLTNASPEVVARTAQAQAKLVVLKAFVEKLDGDDIDIDVNMKGDLSGKLLAVDAQAGKLSSVLGEAGSAAGEAGGAFGKMGASAGSSGAAVGGMGSPLLAVGAILVGVLLAGLTAVVAALVAMAASLAFAVVALGALAVAFGGVAIAAGVFGLAVAQGLKQGGPLAKELQQVVKGLGATFRETASGGVQAFVRDLIPAMRGLKPGIAALKTGFTAFGQAAGNAVRFLSGAFVNLAPKMNQLLKRGSQLLGPFVRIFAALGQILLNIANAAMPFLVAGAKAVASAFEGWARGTENAGALRAVLQTVMGHLRSWLNLINEVGDIFVELFQAIAGQGKGVVDVLARGAGALADWIENNPQEIKQFFADVLPLAGAFAKSVGLIAIAFLKFVQENAPLLTTMFENFNKLVTFIIAAAPAIATALGLILDPLGTIKRLFGEIGLKQTEISTAVSTAWTDIKTSITEAVNGAVTWVKTKWTEAGTWLTQKWNGIKASASRAWIGVKSAVMTPVNNAITSVKQKWTEAKIWLGTAWQSIKARAATIWASIKTAISNAVQQAVTSVKQKWSEAKARLGEIWNSIKGRASTVWNGIKTAISNAVQQAVTSVKQKWSDAKETVGKIWSSIMGKARELWGKLKDIVGKAVSDALGKIKEAAGKFVEAGRALIEGLINGIKAMAGKAADAAKSVVKGALDGAKSLLGIGSPSKVFHHVGMQTMQGFVNGTRAKAGAAKSAVRQGLVDGVTSAVGGLRAKLGEARAVLNATLASIQQRISSLRGHTGKEAAALREHLISMAKAARDNFKKSADSIRNSTGEIRKYKSTVQSVASELRKVSQEAVKAFALKRLANGSQSKELAALQGQSQASSEAQELVKQNDALAEARLRVTDADATIAAARLSGDYTIEQRAMEARAAALQELGKLERDTAIAQAEIARQARIRELEAGIAAKKAEIEERARLGTLGEDAAVAKYQKGLNRQTGALMRQLAQGKISYQQFTDQVNKTLGRVGVKFTPKVADQKALSEGRNEMRRGGSSLITAFTDGMRSKGAEAVGVVKSMLKNIRNLLPGSEPRDKSSPLTKLPARGEAIVENLTSGIRRARSQLASELTGALALPDLNTAMSAGLNLPAPVSLPVAGGTREGDTYNLPITERSGYGAASDSRQLASELTLAIRRQGGFKP